MMISTRADRERTAARLHRAIDSLTVATIEAHYLRRRLFDGLPTGAEHQAILDRIDACHHDLAATLIEIRNDAGPALHGLTEQWRRPPAIGIIVVSQHDEHGVRIGAANGSP